MAADPNKLKVKKELGRKGINFGLARRPQTSQLFVGNSDAKVYQLDPLAEKVEPKELTGHTSYVTSVVLAGKILVTGGYDKRLIWWDAESGEQIRSIDSAHQKWIRRIALSPDQKRLASVSDDMVCRMWNVDTGKMVRELRGHDQRTPHHFPSMLYCCSYSSDGKYLATGDKTGKVIIWEAATSKQLATVEAPEMYTWDPKARIHSIGGVRSVAFSHDSKLLAVGGMGKVGNIDHLGGMARVEIFDWEKNERIHEFKGDTYKGLVERLEFEPSGKWLLAAGGDHNGFVKFFDVAAKKIIKQEKAPMHVHDLTLNETYDTIYAVGHGKVVVWEMKG